MTDRDTLLTVLLLAGVAFGAYLFMQHQRPQPPAVPFVPVEPPRFSPPANGDIFQPPPPPRFGYAHRDPCKMWPWMCP